VVYRNLFNKLILFYNHMAKAPAGTKKSKDAIAKAATQKKGAAKVNYPLCRNGLREKLKKKLTTLFSLTEPTMTESLLVSPSSVNTFQHHL
jgi:hypothetical protein